MQTIQSMVKEFHDTFRVDTSPTMELSVSLRDLRLRLIHEEFHELLVASGFYMALSDGEVLSPEEAFAEEDIVLTHEEGSIQDVIEMADALGDLIYVVYGMSHAMGIDLDAVVTEIHRSNMSKTGIDGCPITNGKDSGGRIVSLQDPTKPAGKILKGDDYFPPDIAGVLARVEQPKARRFGVTS